MVFRISWLRWQCKEAFRRLKDQKFELLAKTWVFGGRKEREEDDFYYGDLQKRLQESHVSMLLLCGNVIGKDWKAYVASHTRTSPLSRLPDLCFVPPWHALQVVCEQVVASFRLWFHWNKEQDSLLKRVLGQAAVDVLREQTLANSLHYWIGREAVKIWNPKMFLTFYEGHAWERCLWLGVRAENPDCKVAGYQHTVILPHAYEQLTPSMDRCKGFSPDIIFCSGPESVDMMRSSHAERATTLIPFGSFRSPSFISRDCFSDFSHKGILVIPEGMLSEAVILFNFAIRLSSLLPQYRFIFRSHPLLPFEEVKSQLALEKGILPPNIEISNFKAMHDDCSRVSAVLYRGSSAVLQTIAEGLKPFYLHKEGEAMIDPLFRLHVWRESVDSPEAFVSRLRAFELSPAEQLQNSLQSAMHYAREYIAPVQQQSIDRFLEALS